MIYPESFEQKVGFSTVRRAVASRCVTAMGADECARIVFSTDFAEVEQRLLATAEMLALTGTEGSGEALPLGEITDLRDVLNRIRVPGTFPPLEALPQLRTTLHAMERIASTFAQARAEGLYPHLDCTARELEEFPGPLRTLDRVLDRFGNIRDNASPELAEIRRSLAAASGSIAAAMRRVMARAVAEGLIEPDATPSVRDGRMVIPVSPMHKRKISGIVHDESASGKTVFIEPAEVVQTNNRLRELQMEERREITRILTAVADELRPNISAMLRSLAVAASLDFIHAKALYARDIDATMPRLEREPQMEWYHACHPGLLASLRAQGKEIVPLDITLTPERRLLIISGPNAGGKSVTLKTVGIVQYMTQCGLLPPVYENSHIGIFSDIFIDIGDDQSIENDLSTYSSHLSHMKQFMARGRTATLLLIDEFGSGTEPQIGGAIAQAILTRFASAGMWGVITTHFQNLKQLAKELPGLVNGSMLYDRQRMEPLFRLSIGSPGSSFAVEIARKIGLPEEIIAQAEEIVGSDYINMDRYLLDIARDRRYWENKRMAIRQKEKRIEQTLADYEADAETLRQKRREILAEAKQEARRILDSSNAAIERTIHDIRRAQADKEETRRLRDKLEQEKQAMESAPADHPLLSKAPKPRKPKAPKPQPVAAIEVGQYVKLEGQDTPGQVLAIAGRKATVSFGMLKTTVELSRLRPTLAKPQTGVTAGARIMGEQQRSRQLDFKQEIDVRGMRADEALQAVTYFIDDAIRFNCKRVRILHGTGTGALRQCIRQYLSTHPGVAHHADEDVRFGGAGITVADLS
ncbi:MAG: Smr/MutS family protein [Muribaculaceae bacterium]|nr:Smr/MutS family protein [Muribaculaceae bacterium]